MFLRLLILLAALLSLIGCDSCGSNSESAAFAKGLSQQRLAQLYRDTADLDLASSSNVRLFKDGKSAIPDQFKYLKPQSIVSDGSIARIHLSGCVDDKVLLIVQGLDGKGHKEITLVPGEAQASIVLWLSK
jgi:hypothetical protein